MTPAEIENSVILRVILLAALCISVLLCFIFEYIIGLINRSGEKPYVVEVKRINYWSSSANGEKNEGFANQSFNWILFPGVVQSARSSCCWLILKSAGDEVRVLDYYVRSFCMRRGLTLFSLNRKKILSIRWSNTLLENENSLLFKQLKWCREISSNPKTT